MEQAWINAIYSLLVFGLWVGLIFCALWFGTTPDKRKRTGTIYHKTRPLLAPPSDFVDVEFTIVNPGRVVPAKNKPEVLVHIS